jgi:lipopolysaccharide/colanic/teichoic acid biosynthesis glycosyltransferase
LIVSEASPALSAQTYDLPVVRVYDLPVTSTLDVYWRAVAAATVQKHTQYRLKRIFDIVTAGVLLALLSPVFLVVALLIKLTGRGPVYYKQQRLMKDWQEFTMLKFRTMVNGADGMLDQVLALNEADGPLFKCRKDPRITFVGRILRATFIDELPQLINVLRGEMSLVGPRPCLLKEASQMEQEMYFRFAVPQGITGPWQTNGYHSLPFMDQLQVERDYVQTWSLGKDLLVLLRTIPIVLLRLGA